MDEKIPRMRPKEKTSTRIILSRNSGAERTLLSKVKATPTKRDRGTGDWNITSIMIVLHCGKTTFISLPVSPPIYRSKSAKFQLCITARSIIIFMRTARPYLCFVFVFLNPEAEIMLNMLFNPLLKIKPQNAQKRVRRKERTT